MGFKGKGFGVWPEVCGPEQPAGWSWRRKGVWWVLTLIIYLIGMAMLAALGLAFLTVDWSARLLRPELEPRPEYLAMAAFMGGLMFMAALPVGWGLLRICFDKAGRGKAAAGGAAAAGNMAGVSAVEGSSEPEPRESGLFSGAELAAVAAAEELEAAMTVGEGAPEPEPVLDSSAAPAAAESDGKANAV